MTDTTPYAQRRARVAGAAKQRQQRRLQPQNQLLQQQPQQLQEEPQHLHQHLVPCPP